MRNRFLLGFLTISLMLVAPSISNADLINDFVTVEQYFRTSLSWEGSTTVVAGDSDIITKPSTAAIGLSINFEASDIYITFDNPQNRYYNPEILGERVFNGIVIGDLDYGIGYSLSDVSVETNLQEYETSDPWNPGMLSFTSDTISIDWANMHPATGQYFNLSLNFEGPQEQPVPEPSTMLLLGIGLAGLAGVSRKKFKR